MRSRKAFINILTALVYELIKVVSTFLIPRLILENFGSNTNGITQAVSQFIGYISLLTAGIGSVTMVALYKPVAENNSQEISGVINATQIFFRKVSKIFLFGLVIFSVIFPLFISEFDFLFTFSLVIILGIGTFGNYYFGLAYRMILVADQKHYINQIIQTILLIIQAVVSLLLINGGSSIHIIQLVSTLIFLINPIIIYFFVKKKYEIDKRVSPNYDAINQRGDAFAHQIANFINDNTDLILLTLFTNLKEVSVYSVFTLISNGVRMIITSVTMGVQAAFGNMFAKGEIRAVEKNLELFEFIIHSISIVLYSSMALLIISFIDLYTLNILDANYHRPLFGYLLTAVGFFVAVRIPYQAVTRAAGHFKQTRNGAIFETILNIVLSVSLVIPFGMTGLIIGTLVATIFRTIQYAIYSFKKLLNKSLINVVKRYLISFFAIGTIILIVNFIPLYKVNSYVDWIINSFIITSIGIAVTMVYSLIFYLKELINMKKFILRIFKKGDV